MGVRKILSFGDWGGNVCNERADKEANLAANLEQKDTPVTIQSAKAAIRRERKKNDGRYYGVYKRIQTIKYNPRTRWEQVNWNQFATGHSSLSRAMMNKFGVIDSPNCNDCGEPDTCEHILLNCPTGDGIRRNITAENTPEELMSGGNLFKLLRMMGRSDIGAAAPEGSS